MDLGQHVNCQLKDKRVIAATASQRLIVMRIIFALAKELRLLAAHLVDSHLHLLLLESRKRSMELARRIESAVKQRLKLPVGFVEAYPESVRNQRHLDRAFDYVLRQQSKHGLGWDAYLESSNLPDLLGMRLLGSFTARHVRQNLPRIKRSQLLAYYGLEALEPRPGSQQLLVPASCAAAGLMDLRGRRAEVHQAKIASVAVGSQLCSNTQLGDLLGLDPRSVRRLGKQQARPELVEAIRWQLGLREMLAAPSERDAFDHP